MANIRVTCPACKSELEIDSTFEGQEVECGNCLEVFRAARPGSGGTTPSSGGTGKIPGAAPRSSAGSGSGRGRPAPRSRRRDDDDADERRRRDDDYDDDDYGPPPPRRGSGEGDGAATAALVLGILAVFPGCCCGVLAAPLGISAVVTGMIGMKSQNNKGLAVAGLVMGVLSLCWAGFALLAGLGNAMLNPNRFN